MSQHIFKKALTALSEEKGMEIYGVDFQTVPYAAFGESLASHIAFRN
jgi:hypothetical protein